jgi:glycerol-3-phosphate dehydrogenase subunit B
VGGAAGARFEKARDAVCRASSIEVSRGRVSAIERMGERFVVRFDDGGEKGAGRDGEVEALAVVLATGGVAAGGVAFVWDPERGAHGFRLAYDAPVALALDGEPGDSGGSLYGASLETRGLGVLERVGIHAAATGAVIDGNVNVSGLFAAGDALAERPRTVLEAVRSGIRAARAALPKIQA